MVQKVYFPKAPVVQRQQKYQAYGIRFCVGLSAFATAQPTPEE